MQCFVFSFVYFNTKWWCFSVSCLSHAVPWTAHWLTCGLTCFFQFASDLDQILPSLEKAVQLPPGLCGSETTESASIAVKAEILTPSLQPSTPARTPTGMNCTYQHCEIFCSLAEFLTFPWYENWSQSNSCTYTSASGVLQVWSLITWQWHAEGITLIDNE